MYRFLTTIILLVSTIVASYSLSQPETVVSRRPLEQFPKVIEGWTAVEEQYMARNILAALKVDDYIMRTYVNKKDGLIGLYIGYFKTQREGKQVHSPRQCLPGAGWSIIQQSKYILGLENHNPSKVPINLYLMGKGDQRELYLWWYQGRGRMYANEYMNKLYLIWDRMTRNRTDGALVRINMPLKGDVDQTLITQETFIKRFFQVLHEYIPD